MVGRGRGRKPVVNSSGGGSRSSKHRESQLSEALLTKDRELQSLKKEFEKLKSTHAILIKDNEEANSSLETMELYYNSVSRDFDNYKQMIRESEARDDKGIVRRVVGWPLRMGQSILSRETRKREEKIKDRGVLIASLNERVSSLKKKVSEQRKDIAERAESARKWKDRYDILSAEKRSEKGLERDSLIDGLRESLANQRKRIVSLEEQVSQLKKRGVEREHRLGSVYEAVQKADYEFENLEFTENCWKSAKKSPFKNTNLVYETLETMAIEASQWVKKQDGTGSFEDEIKMYLDVAENDSTDRYWKVGDINKRMNRHVKLGVDRDPSKTLRIYYEIERSGPLRIGWCGNHP